MYLYCVIVGGKFGVLIKMGLYIFVDLCMEFDVCYYGGVINVCVKVVCVVGIVLWVEYECFCGEDYFFYFSFLLYCVFLCGMVVDLCGNISIYEEVFYYELLVMVQVVCNLGGIVIV